MKEGNNRNLHCIVINSRWKENRRVIAWVGDGGALTGERHEDTF